MFDTDSAQLSVGALQALDDMAAVVLHTAGAKGAPQPVLVIGYCEERGTAEYNLALGQRRADAVRRYLKALGVAEIIATSAGKEQPLMPGHDEAAWSRNRRVEVSR